MDRNLGRHSLTHYGLPSVPTKIRIHSHYLNQVCSPNFIAFGERTSFVIAIVTLITQRSKKTNEM